MQPWSSMTAPNKPAEIDPDGDPAPPANLHRGDSPRWRFHHRYRQWGLFPPFHKWKRTPLLSPACINALQEHDKKLELPLPACGLMRGYLELGKLSFPSSMLNAFLSLCHFLPLTRSIALHLVCGGHCKWLDVVCNMQKYVQSAKRSVCKKC